MKKPQLATPAKVEAGPGTTVIDGKTYLTQAQLSTRWNGRPSEKTIENWRFMHRGPVPVKLGRRVLYPLDVVQEWERTNGIGRD